MKIALKTALRGSGSTLTLLALSLYSMSALAETQDECLLRQLKEGDNTLTIGEIKRRCDNTNESSHEGSNVLANRVQEEKETRGNRFAITPHKPNYILPISYNDTPNEAPFGLDSTDDFSNTEIKFQFSFKAPLAEGVFNGYGDVYVAYTNTSWWQAYNSNSAPFRETNHEPEAFIVLPTNYQLFGFDLKAIIPGISHQSNGRSGDLSRSWNRIYTQFVFSRDNMVLALKPWWRIPESDKNEENSSKGDDNPNIEKYMGYGELHFGYQLNEHNLGILLRNNLRKDNKGAVQLNWSFPINERFRGYVQYFNGYGESLIDYDASTNRIGIGVMLTDWL